MTRDRIFGEGSEFGEWLRKQSSIPSSKVVATDCDWIIHRYKTDIDGIGVRDIQAMMLLEVKTRNAEPRYAQLHTMWLQHLHSRTGRRRIFDRGNQVFHHGVSVLSMSGTTPDNSERMRWGRFQESCNLTWKEINREQLDLLLLFELDPDRFTPRPHRRHHVRRVIEALEQFPLGFSVPVNITHRS
jgi:hypothetical protein